MPHCVPAATPACSSALLDAVWLVFCACSTTRLSCHAGSLPLLLRIVSAGCVYTYAADDCECKATREAEHYTADAYFTIDGHCLVLTHCPFCAITGVINIRILDSLCTGKEGLPCALHPQSTRHTADYVTTPFAAQLPNSMAQPVHASPWLFCVKLPAPGKQLPCIQRFRWCSRPAGTQRKPRYSPGT